MKTTFLPPVSVRTDKPFPITDSERHEFCKALLERLWRKMEDLERIQSHKFIMIEDFDAFVQARAEESKEPSEFYRFCAVKFTASPPAPDMPVSEAHASTAAL